MDGVDEPLAFGRVQLREGHRRRQSGVVHHVVAVAASDPGDRPLIPQVGVHPTRVLAGPQELGGFVGEGLGSELGERAVVARGEHPPAGLPLGAEFLHEDRGPARESQPDDRAPRLRRLRRGLDVDSPTLGEVEQQPHTPVEAQHRELAPARDLLELEPTELLGTRRVGLQRRELQRVGSLERRANHDLAESFGHRPHLGELGHPRLTRPARPRPCARSPRIHPRGRHGCDATRCTRGSCTRRARAWRRGTPACRR